MSLTHLLVPTFTHMLRGMSAWLDKAAAHAQESGNDPDALLSKRLARDMYPLAAQIRFACFQAEAAAHRLRGEALPQKPEEVRLEGASSGEQTGSMAEAQNRIADAILVAAGASVGPQDHRFKCHSRSHSRSRFIAAIEPSC